MPKTARRLLIIVPAIFLVLVVAALISARIFTRKIEPEVRSLAIHYLEQHFNARVSLAHLQVLLPKVSSLRLLCHGGSGIVAGVKGEGLSLSYQGRSDIPPLLTVATFQCNVDLGTLHQQHPRVARIALDGVTIVVPPKSDAPHPQNNETQAASGLIIDNLDFSNTRFVVLPKAAGRKPL